MGYYDEYFKELAAQRARLRRDLEKSAKEGERALRGAYASRGLTFSGLAQKQLGGLQEKTQEAIARGESALAMEEAKTKAMEKAEREAAKAARLQALGTLLGAGAGALAGTFLAPGVGTLFGAQLGSLLGSTGGQLIGGFGGYAPAFTTIPSNVASAIEAAETEKLKRYLQDLLEFYRKGSQPGLDTELLKGWEAPPFGRA